MSPVHEVFHCLQKIENRHGVWDSSPVKCATLSGQEGAFMKEHCTTFDEQIKGAG